MSTENTGGEGKYCPGCKGTCTGQCWKKLMGFGVLLLAVSGSLLILVMFFTQLKEYKYVGRSVDVTSISVSGEGEAYAKPDVAEVSFSINEKGKTVAEAQKKVNEKMADIIAFLKKSGVEDRDVKNTYYNFSPTYEWQKSASPLIPCYGGYCPPEGKQVQTGFEVNQSVSIKIRKIDASGDIVSGLGEKGATNMSNIDFTVDDMDKLKADARKDAITKAKAKAAKLSADLGVELVRIVSFNEGGDYPMMNYARSEVMMTKSADAGMPAPAVIPVGQNKVLSNVTITYEIR